MATSQRYQLLYHPTIPGRGEFIRLAFEAAGVPYTDVSNVDKDNYSLVLAACSQDNHGDDCGNPPIFAPPALKVAGGRGDGKDLLISQTANALLYLGPKLGLVGSEDDHLYYVNSLALTALDLNNAAHDTHHPIAAMKYYEDQKEAALAKSQSFREERLPKFLSLLERTLKWNEVQGNGKYTVGPKLTYADTTWWQVVDGVSFAFPKEMAARRKDYPLVFEKFYTGLKEEQWLKGYLSSDRRLKYSHGVFRHYPEMDRQ